VRDYVRHRNKFEDNKCKTFGLVLGQCPARRKNKADDRNDWKLIEAKGDPIEILSTKAFKTLSVLLS